MEHENYAFGPDYCVVEDAEDPSRKPHRVAETPWKEAKDLVVSYLRVRLGKNISEERVGRPGFDQKGDKFRSQTISRWGEIVVMRSIDGCV